MAELTADDVYTKLSEVIDKWHTFLDQQRAWYGAPDADNDTDPDYAATPGKRPLSDDVGNTSLIDSPAELERRVSAVIDAFGLLEDPANFESRVNATLDEMQALKEVIDLALVEVENAEPLAQQALDDAATAQAQLDTIFQELLDLKNATRLSEENALAFQTEAYRHRLAVETAKDDFEKLIWYGI